MASNGDFIERHGLWTAEQQLQAKALAERIRKIQTPQHTHRLGRSTRIVRGKTVTATEFLGCLNSGKDFQLVTAIFDTTNHPIVPPFGAENHLNIPEMIGLPDGVLVPDPATFRVLPWVNATGWILSDAYFRNGKPCPISTRQVLRDQLSRLAEDGFEMTVGLEFEFYVYKCSTRVWARRIAAGRRRRRRLRISPMGISTLPIPAATRSNRFNRMLQDNLEALGLPLLPWKMKGPRPVRAHFCAVAGHAGGGCGLAVPHGGQTALPAQRLSCQLHGGAEDRQ